MSSKELKPQIYYLIRRGWYEQLVRLCDDIMSRKGKDILAMYWKAFGVGMMGNLKDAIVLLEGFQSRRDMQYAISVALLYFRQKSPMMDYEAIETLKSELSVAEDVTKEAGMVLASRFLLFTKDYYEAGRICQKIMRASNRSAAPSAFDIEAYCVQQWCVVNEVEDAATVTAEHRRSIQAIDANFQGKSGDQFDIDSLMLWAQSRQVLNTSGAYGEVLNIYNQVIAMHPWFMPALADKALLLATAGEWEQALDTSQRLLDGDNDNLDALQIIAVHAFTQESHVHDAVQKLDDLDAAIIAKESAAVDYIIQIAAIFSCICARQSRALQICVRMLDRVRKNIGQSNVEDDAKLACQIGYINLMQGAGQYENAMKMFRDATKKDPNNIKALEGMILCQLYEGQYEDAESQIELITLMHGVEELGYEFQYYQTLLCKMKRDNKDNTSKKHVELLNHCRDAFLACTWTIGNNTFVGKNSTTESVKSTTTIATYNNAFQNLITMNPDFMLMLAIEYLTHLESASTSFIPSNNNLLTGGGLKGQLAGMQEPPTPVLVAPAYTMNNQNTYATVANYSTALPAVTSGIGSITANDGNFGSTLISAEITPPVQSGMDLLNNVLKVCPGLVSAYIELARCYLAVGSYDEASRVLNQSLALQPHNSSVLVMMAKVEAGRFETATADRVLEQALGCDFSIRSSNLFKLVKSYIRAQQGRLDESMTEIEQVLSSPEIGFTLGLDGTTTGGVVNSGTSASAKNDRRAAQEAAINQQTQAIISSTTNMNSYADSLRLTADDRVSAYVAYASLLSKSRRLKEANKILSQAKVIFAGSSEEVQILVASSQLCVERNDYDSAIRMLDKIAFDEASANTTYTRAQILKADILLNHNHDKEGFTKTYQQLAEKESTSKNYAMLGEAYLKILNPDAAIDALEQAYRLDPSNNKLRGRIGRALAATHEYRRAIDFYEAAIRELSSSSVDEDDGKSNALTIASASYSSTVIPIDAAMPPTKKPATMSNSLISLSHDLAKLYIKLGKSEKASRVLVNILHSAPTDTISMRQDVTTLLLLARVNAEVDPEDVLQTLLDAYRIQKQLVVKVRSGVVSSGDTVERERYILSDICDKIGVVHIETGENTNAEQMFNESVTLNPQNTSAMLGLAKIFFARNDKELCVAQCNKIVSADPSNATAAMLLSEALFQQIEGEEGDIEGALDPLRNFLTQQPNNYSVLEKTILLLRRAGKLDEVVNFITAAESSDPRYLTHAGYHYNNALYAKYTNDIGKAISEFNLARKDEQWGANALTHMIELYLNPDQEGIWEEKEQVGPLDETTRANIAAAEELLKELHPRAKDPQRVEILENYCAMATRNKPSVDRAMQSFSDLLDKDQDYLPAVLGMATGFMIEKNQHKARNLLKRVGKMEMHQHDGDDFEKSNLLLAKFYIDKGKNDLAQEVCKKALAQNKSCSQAWEILGLIMEKDSNYDLAADCYEKAWKLEFEASASVGFKLAFCYLKSKLYVNAIDVCEKVLELYPDYPRITDEILKKAQQSIRTV